MSSKKNVAPLVLATAAAFLLVSSSPKKKKSCNIENSPIHFEEYIIGEPSPKEKLPMVIYFHGLGSNPAYLGSRFEELNDAPKPFRIIAPRGGLERSSTSFAWWGLRAKSEDQAKLASQMQEAAKSLKPFLKELTRCYPTQGKKIITGHSQGGMLVLALASMYPKEFGFALPVSGWLPEKLWSSKLPNIRAIHGQNDVTVPYKRSKDYYEKMKIPFDGIKGADHALAGQSPQWKKRLYEAMEDL